jgi:signal transduction histidine kinase
VLTDAARSVWDEPRAPHAPNRVWRDWALVAVVDSLAVLEGVLRTAVPWRPLGLLVALALSCTLLWRRTHPLAVVVVAFGAGIVLDLASLVGHSGGSVDLYVTVFLLLLPYALFRWGSGPEVAIGSAVVLLAYGVSIATDHTTRGDAAIGFVLLVLPAVLGACVRFWTTSRTRELDQVRLREREQLARELHDTVAHHVSAMVVRAQAGRVVAASRPGAAIEALEIIEAEGSRTLAEMRAMVGALRDREDTDLAPQAGLADIERLAAAVSDEPRIEVHVSGDVDDIRSSVGAAAYRIAQEAVTNAVRHARHATQIVVSVAADPDCVRLTVRDDGDPVAAARAHDGYGVVGMTERATLLGGTVHAGPCAERGWAVVAVLPRLGPAG